MGYTTTDRIFRSLVQNNKTAVENGINVPHGQIAAGYYTSAAPTLANGDFGFLRVDSEGKLITTASISGDVNVDNTSLSTTGYIGKASGTNADFTTAYAAATQILLSGFPSGISAIEADDVVSIQQVDTTGAVTNTYTRDDITLSSDGTTLTVAGAAFAAADTFIVTTNIARPSSGADVDDTVFTPASGQGQVIMGVVTTDEVGVADKGAIGMTVGRSMKVRDDAYDSLTQSNKTAEVNPLNMQYVNETLADGASTATSYYVNMLGAKQLTLQFMTMTDTTATISFTVDPDETDYVDVTLTYAGAAAVPADANAIVIIDTPHAIRKVKITTTDDGGGAMAYTIYALRNY
jgi:hypothetical protein